MINKEDAINIINQAINSATLKGVYTLNDITFIIQALNKISELEELVPET